MCVDLNVTLDGLYLRRDGVRDGDVVMQRRGLSDIVSCRRHRRHPASSSHSFVDGLYRSSELTNSPSPSSPPITTRRGLSRFFSVSFQPRRHARHVPLTACSVVGSWARMCGARSGERRTSESTHSGCSTSRAACSSATRSAASLAPACASMMAHSCAGERPATRAPMRWEAMGAGGCLAKGKAGLGEGKRISLARVCGTERFGGRKMHFSPLYTVVGPVNLHGTHLPAVQCSRQKEFLQAKKNSFTTPICKVGKLKKNPGLVILFPK